MKTFEIEVETIDWCGYKETFTVTAESEEAAIEKATEEFCDLYSLLPVGDGEYADTDTLDEDGEPTEDTTSINATVIMSYESKK